MAAFVAFIPIWNIQRQTICRMEMGLRDPAISAKSCYSYKDPLSYTRSTFCASQELAFLSRIKDSMTQIDGLPTMAVAVLNFPRVTVSHFGGKIHLILRLKIGLAASYVRT